jgi:hypothetical protein
MMKLLLLATFALSIEGFVQPRRRPRPLRLAFSRSDYAHTVDALARELSLAHERLKKIEILSSRLKEMETRDSKIASIKKHDSLLRAVAEAKAAIELHGTTSCQAKMAFKEVDALAIGRQPAEESKPSYRYSESSIRSHHAYNAIVDSVLLQESMEAIAKILVLEHFVKVEQKCIDAEGRKTPDVLDNMPGVPWLSP